MVVDNRLGANGIIASSFVAMAPPDGSTLLLATGSHATINPATKHKHKPDVRCRNSVCSAALFAATLAGSGKLWL